MTTFYPQKIRCSNCKQEQEVFLIGSTNRFGAMDLDTRPPEMERSTIGSNIHRCVNCGYCAASLEYFDDKIPEILKSQVYQSQLNDEKFNETANSYLCHAIISEQLSLINSATWACIHAAWVCDDAKNISGSLFCRQKAIKLIKTAEELGVLIAPSEEEQFAIKIDLMRRANDFENVQKLIENRILEIKNIIIRRVLTYQLRCCYMNDNSCYTLESIH